MGTWLPKEQVVMSQHLNLPTLGIQVQHIRLYWLWGSVHLLLEGVRLFSKFRVACLRSKGMQDRGTVLRLLAERRL